MSWRKTPVRELALNIGYLWGEAIVCFQPHPFENFYSQVLRYYSNKAYLQKAANLARKYIKFPENIHLLF